MINNSIFIYTPLGIASQSLNQKTIEASNNTLNMLFSTTASNFDWYDNPYITVVVYEPGTDDKGNHIHKQSDNIKMVKCKELQTYESNTLYEEFYRN